MIHHTKEHSIDKSLVFACAVLSIIIISSLAKPVLEIKNKTKVLYTKLTIPQSAFNQTVFNTVHINAKAYVVYDILTESVIASKNKDERLPLASITKVMTSVSARLHYGKNYPIIITDKSIEGGYDLGLKRGQKWTLSELIKYTLVFSSNDGAHAIADNLGGRKVFIQNMNTDAKNLGLDLTFTDPAGLDEHGNIGGLGSALYVAKLFAYARKNFPELYDATTKTRASVSANTGKITGIPNTNQSINTLSGAEMSKTGYTDLAGGNLAVVVDVSLGRPVVIVVLGSTKEGRFVDVKNLYYALHTATTNNVPISNKK